jgi:hypothetical protein
MNPPLPVPVVVAPHTTVIDVGDTTDRTAVGVALFGKFVWSLLPYIATKSLVVYPCGLSKTTVAVVVPDLVAEITRALGTVSPLLFVPLNLSRYLFPGLGQTLVRITLWVVPVATSTAESNH